MVGNLTLAKKKTKKAKASSFPLELVLSFSGSEENTLGFMGTGALGFADFELGNQPLAWIYPLPCSEVAPPEHFKQGQFAFCFYITIHYNNSTRCSARSVCNKWLGNL